MTSTSRTSTPVTNAPTTHPHHVSPLPLYMALVGTFLLRFGGGVMGILIGLYLAAKDTEMRGGLFGHLVSSSFKHSSLSGSIVKMTPNPSYVIPATLVGIITASYFITELGGSFISGSLIDRHGPKRYMIFGPMFGAIAVFITAILHLTGDSTVLQFALFLGLLFATRLLEGASGATTNPATLAYIAAYTDGEPKLRSRVSGYFEICTLIGAGIGFVFGGVLWRELGQTG